ncbi:DUF5027 family lipoprotein [Cellulosilyticum ruminicola]|uniref:DUF5027 family lipoprotein n=1 Tax=Cellulosilyticum ruminicola TaxID=425254 RepID=UPI0006D0D92C|nr:hypothetical protein [Cellulosilyticum ruminicola]
MNNFVRYQEGKKIVVCDVTLENISIPTGELDISFIQLRSKTDFLNKTYNDIERIDNEISYFSGGDFSNLKRYYMFNLPQSEKNNYQVAFLVDPDSAELNNLALELGVSPDSSQGIALQTT